LSLSPEERDLLIDALGGRIRRHVEILVGVDTSPEIESELEATSSRERPESAHRHDDPDVSGSLRSRSNWRMEEKH
jgi:hypothetical protein